MNSSRLVPAIACAVMALGVLFVAFVVFAGWNDAQPGSEDPVGYVPPPEFLEEVQKTMEAQERAAAAAQERGDVTDAASGDAASGDAASGDAPSDDAPPAVGTDDAAAGDAQEASSARESNADREP